ncbi:unnamed protein product [Dibothriocephalus latus]|uniref:Uncharacterized protein n=1 Tax=Dibothriocephalus latus TaxID=60516 RepID=A0A3P7LA00_DIBLA|nr:unnamed protein product [Dibothriocephalus latus]
MVMTVFACLMAIDLECDSKRAPRSPSTDNKTEVLSIDVSKTETIKTTNLDFHPTVVRSARSTLCLHCGHSDSNLHSPAISELPSVPEACPGRHVTSVTNINASSAQWVKLARRDQENRPAATSPNWNRVSKKSEIFAASVRESAASVQHPWVNCSRRDVRSPPRSGFAAAYEEYAQNTVDAVKRPSGSKGIRTNGGRVFMAADIPK